MKVFPQLRGDDHTSLRVFTGVFFHGALENMFPHALCYIQGNEPPHGIHQIEVDNAGPCTLYYWRSRSTGWNRGLIVADSDTEAITSAEDMFHHKQQVLW
jgi:hypothetical protein